MCFLAIVYLPLIGTIVPFFPQNNKNENRVLNANPGVPTSLSEFFNFPKTFQNYFNDNFKSRGLLIDLNITLKTKLSSKPFKDDKLLIGKDGWYFSNFQKVIDDYRAVKPFTSFEIQSIINQIRSTKLDLETKGIPYYLLIVPNKHTIYSEYLPEHIKKVGEKSRFEQLLPYLENEDINLIDIRNELRAVKEDKDVYFKTDSHWNLHGSFIGYTKLFETISNDFPNIIPSNKDQFIIREIDKNGGDIVAMMGKEEEIRDTFIEYYPIGGFNFKESSLGNYTPPAPKIFSPEISVTAFESDASELTAVIFKDSYGGYMQQFINPHFKRSVYIWGHDYYLNKDVVQEEKPDLVIHIIVERYLYTLLRAAEVNDK